MTADRDALLARILDAPEEDAPRLVYADWLDEHDEGDRAEFIRVQVELARLDGRCYRRGGVSQWCAGANHRRHSPDCPAEQLRRREAELWWLVGEFVPLPFVKVLGPDDSPAHNPSERPVSWANVSRGFVSAVTCDCRAWLDLGPAVVREHPVEKVTLAGKEPLSDSGWEEYFGRPSGSSGGTRYYWYGTGHGGDAGAHDWMIPQPIADAMIVTSHPDEDAAHDALSATCIRWAKAESARRAEAAV